MGKYTLLAALILLLLFAPITEEEGGGANWVWLPSLCQCLETLERWRMTITQERKRGKVMRQSAAAKRDTNSFPSKLLVLLFFFFGGGEVIQFSESPFVARVLRLPREGREDEIESLWQQGGMVGQLDRKNRRKRKALERKRGEGGSPTHGHRACRVRSTLSRKEKCV